MKYETSAYIKFLVDKFNIAVERKDDLNMILNRNMILAIIKVLEIEEIESLQIKDTDPFRYFSTITIEEKSLKGGEST